MLGRNVTFKTLLRLAGVLCLLWSIYHIFQIATFPVSEVNSNSYLIQSDRNFALFLMARKGLHWFLAAGVLLMCFSFERARVAYWGLQVSLWIVGFGIWYLVNNSFDSWTQNPMGLLLTILCSIVLLALYKPITFLFTKMMRSHVLVKPQVKDERFEEYELQVQGHVNKDD